MKTISANDQAELDKFSHYLKAIAKWDADNFDAPVSFSVIAYNKKRIAGHFAIYKEIYGEDVSSPLQAREEDKP